MESCPTKLRVNDRCDMLVVYLTADTFFTGNNQKRWTDSEMGCDQDWSEQLLKTQMRPEDIHTQKSRYEWWNA
jgi:hypothetical protein